jgi:hypothetical protein
MFESTLGAMGLSQSLVGLDFRRWCRAHVSNMSGERSTIDMLMDNIPGARALGTSFISTIGLPTCLKSSCLKRRLQRGDTCG